MSVFETLNALNVNEHTESKNGLTYLSWAWAWAEVKKVYPDANYVIWKDEQGRPYIYDEKLGYMVFTTMTIDGLTHEMWLFVMDNKNKAMKAEPYTFLNRYKKEETVQAATMFDINTTLMRCLVKNLAMFGLGLYIYAGEDLPESDKLETLNDEDAVVSEVEARTFMQRCEKAGLDYKDIGKKVGANSLLTMTKLQMGKALKMVGDIENGQ